ncbi:MAG TPA: septation regulator SpoVG [Candidatus Binatia bacterium]|jgi:stage V sporulation protein G|nr:septation regulator SpoVG [Candidatus Binatia bacterium]
MEITEVRIFPVEEEKLKAFVSIIIDDCFVVSDIKIIHGTSGLFISMPSKKRKNGTFRDIAHPLNNDTRKKIEDKVLARYREVLAHMDSGTSRTAAEERDGSEDEAGRGRPTSIQPDDSTPA